MGRESKFLKLLFQIARPTFDTLYNYPAQSCRTGYQPMIGENRQLVTNEPIEFEK